MDLSIVIPCYNEQECLPLTLERLEAVMGPTGLDWELVLVNDGSADGTWRVVTDAVAAGKLPVTAINFSRNFGKEAALYAGLEHARGDVVGLMDADLQQTPEVLLAMYKDLVEHPEADCVAAYQTHRHEGALKSSLQSGFYKLFNAVAEKNVHMLPDASDFRVFRRPVADALLSLPEYNRFSKGLFAWVGFETRPFAYEPEARAAGTTKWSMRGLVRYALDGIFAFSTAPLKLATWLGALSALASVIYFFVVIWETVISGGKAPDGYPTIVCLLLLFGGLILLTLGIIGEYVARLYLEGKRRPVYLAKNVIRSAGREDR